MGLGGGVADVDGLADLGVGQAAGDEAEDLPLPLGEQAQGGGIGVSGATARRAGRAGRSARPAGG